MRPTPQRRWRVSLSPIQFFPPFDIEMGHPPALDAERVTRLGVFAGDGPSRLATTSSPALRRTHSRADFVQCESEYFSRKERQNQKGKDKQHRKVRVHELEAHKRGSSDGTNASRLAPGEKGQKGRAQRDVSSAEPGKTSSRPKGWAASRCLASWQHRQRDTTIAPMRSCNRRDNPKL